MKQLRKFIRCERLILLDRLDALHLERFTSSEPALRLLPIKLKIGGMTFRQRSHWTTTCVPRTEIRFHKSVQIISLASYSTSKDSKKSSLTESNANEETAVSTSVAQKLKQTSETMFWGGIIFAGLTFAVCVIYAITTELFSSNSAHRVYSKALRYVSKNERVLNEIGDQIKGFGEETRRGRRQHVSHIEYSKDGRNYLRMKFYVKGSRGQGTVHLEMIENEKGDYEYRYMFVIIDSDPSLYKKTIILEDNRSKHEAVGGIGSLMGSSLETESLKELDLSNG